MTTLRDHTCLAGILLTSLVTTWADTSAPLAGTDELVFEEKDGLLIFEAEHFHKQELTDTRAWHLTTKETTPEISPDGDPSHIGGASGGAYLEVLPDTRRSHDDKLIRGENFAPEAGKMAILSYRVHVNDPGRYRIWGRVYSTNTEDNGFHVGLDGEWPESGQRWQTTVKRRWHWESRQRTAEVHVGVPGKLWLDIEKAGAHTIHIAMREDGIELDKLLFAKDFNFTPKGLGPRPTVKAGAIPKAFPYVEPVAQVAAKKPYPDHWGDPPAIQTRDYVPLPGGYGHGSSTLKSWIQENLDRDAAQAQAALPKKERSREPALAGDRGADGDGAVVVSGEMKAWHKVTLTLNGPFAHEHDRDPNPFTDYALEVVFTHTSGAPSHRVPGYFAADGQAGESSASSGNQWRVHLSPDKPGEWTYKVTMRRGRDVAIGGGDGEALADYAKEGSFTIAPTDKHGRDFRGHGRLQYVGKGHLRFAGSGKYFLKAGADAPETFLAYTDFDNTEARNPKKAPLKTWEAHARDWQEGDPSWKDGKGKGMIGALNYLAGKGANVFSFLPYNAGGDGDNVWPFAAYGEKFHYDCSKLDQWGMVFDHATSLGLYAHFKLQETENDDNNRGHRNANVRVVPAALDGGDLGPERKLYLREIIARFGHLLALNWNLGEENTQSAAQQKAMIDYIVETDPYDHHIVIHTYPDQQDKVYNALIGDQSKLSGISLQNSNVRDCHWQVVKWAKASAKAGRPWVVAFDEPGTAGFGMPPDPGYPGTPENFDDPSVDDTRKYALWGTFLGGGIGVEYYFGYKLPQNDIVCEDWRSRDLSWDYCRHALTFFERNQVPFWDMHNADSLVDATERSNEAYAFAKPGEVYVVYLPNGGTRMLDLTGTDKTFEVRWYNPRTGGELALGSVEKVSGGGKVSLGTAPVDGDGDWVALVR